MHETLWWRAYLELETGIWIFVLKFIYHIDKNLHENENIMTRSAYSEKKS